MRITDGQITRRIDGSFVYDNYHIVSKELDPYGKYDYAETLAYAQAHPDRVIIETAESIAKEQAKQELVQLDSMASRAIEDLYEQTGKTPHASTKAIIDRKKELRQLLK